MWVTFVILGLGVLAAATFVGGFVEAGNHSHVVVTHDTFGGSHRGTVRDWNYAYAGIGWALALLVVAGVLSLLRAIAVDVRTIASRPS